MYHIISVMPFFLTKNLLTRSSLKFWDQTEMGFEIHNMDTLECNDDKETSDLLEGQSHLGTSECCYLISYTYAHNATDH